MTGPSSGVFGDREVALVDLLDRLLAGGVVLTGDLTISLAGVDLIRLSLRALLVSIGAADVHPVPLPSGGPDTSGPASLGAGPDVPEVPG